MIAMIRVAAISMLLSAADIAAVAAAPPSDGLVPVRTKEVDEAFLRPRADFRPYGKVVLMPASVTLERGWLRDVNRRGVTLAGRVTEADAQVLLESARAGFDEAWTEVFRSAGYEIVTAPGDDVLLVSPSVRDLQVNAPATNTTGIERNYANVAGGATLEVEVRDSRTGELLGRIRDKRQTLKYPTLQRVDAASNDRALGRLFALWGGIATRELATLKARSPLPEALSPDWTLAPR